MAPRSTPWQNLPGFRDFYPEECLQRNALFAVWRDVARRYGFVEYEGPHLEPTDLYRQKSGEEISSQLFAFIDKGEREVALRPELTPTLARMVIAKERHYKKPLKWFSIGSFYRYEKPQKGRLREFYQLNVDTIGEASADADAELMALSIDIMRALGFDQSHFRLRLSDRTLWEEFMAQKKIAAHDAFLAIIDKWSTLPEEKKRESLAEHGLQTGEVEQWMAHPPTGNIHAIEENLKARGLGEYVEIDLSVVRGLAYYTGAVFEIFDRSGAFRAVAGGGRYDHLLGLLSDGQCNLPAVGLGMGDAVLLELIAKTPPAKVYLQEKALALSPPPLYVVLTNPESTSTLLSLVQLLRDAGYPTVHALSSTKVGKQFQAAEAAQCKVAIVVGAEYPEIKIKNLYTRQETTTSPQKLLEDVATVWKDLTPGPLIA